jgi:hypothetical protein
MTTAVTDPQPPATRSACVPIANFDIEESPLELLTADYIRTRSPSLPNDAPSGI